MAVDVVPLVDEGLGNSAYLVDLGDGRALVVDVSRDLRAVYRAARQRGVSVAFAADTHLHADFLTGATQLATTEGARVLAAAAGHREYPHHGVRDGDEVDVGGLRLRTVATPGHTHEHVSFLLLDGHKPLGVFTGGSLIVGSAARTDLVDPERTEELARAQYHSLRRLAELPDEVAVWPTHGVGSFCSAPPGTERVSTIGQERTSNPLLRANTEDAFVKTLLDSLGSFPPYFLRLAELNRRGPALLDQPPALAPLTVAEVRVAVADGAVLVDARPVTEFAAAHIPGALSIPLRPVFATWLGWLAPPDRSLIIIRGGDQDPAEIAWQAGKIGYDTIAGELAGGMPAWTADGRPTSTIRLVDPSDVDITRVLDVRQDNEFAAGHLPASTHTELGALAEHAADMSGGTVLMCGHGERAMSAASALEQAGHRDLAVMVGGPDDWADVTGRELDTGR